MSDAARPDLHPHNVVIDCADHAVVLPFWEAALGWTSHRVNDQFVALRAPADQGIGFDILFQKVPEPKTAKNRAHIDFDAGDMDAEVGVLHKNLRPHPGDDLVLADNFAGVFH